MWEFRESAQHPHHEHFKALCHLTQLSVLDAGCDLQGAHCRDGKDECESGCLLGSLPENWDSAEQLTMSASRTLDYLPSKSWFYWPVVQSENEAHIKDIRYFKEQEKII